MRHQSVRPASSTATYLRTSQVADLLPRLAQDGLPLGHGRQSCHSSAPSAGTAATPSVRSANSQPRLVGEGGVS